MKTAISVPNDAFRRIEVSAASVGMNRSEFFVAAALQYADLLESESLVERIDSAVRRGGEGLSAESHTTVERGREELARLTVDDEW